jgi:hypothetical protein
MFVRSVLGMIVILFAVAPKTVTAADVESTIAQLSKIRLDRAQVYSVRDITLDRDVFSITLNRGTIAFTEAVDGRVTGAVFLGSGDILAIPPDPIEKRQLFGFTGSALLSEHFETAVFRFTDGSHDDILKELRKHAAEVPEPADVEQILRWEAEIQRRATFLNDRILTDMFASRVRPFFLAQIEGSRVGWFDAVYDDRRGEEVFAQQNTGTDGVIVWMSFNKRSEIRDPATAARQDLEKAVFEVTSLNEAGNQVRVKLKVEGERVLNLPLSSGSVTRVALDNGAALPFLAARDHVAVVLPESTRSGEQISFHLEFAPEGGRVAPSRFATGAGTVIPASYRDEWIVEGLVGYASVAARPGLLSQARTHALAASPQGDTYESRGPLWIGSRLMQRDSTPAAKAAYQDKSIWVMHMLRYVIQHDEPEPLFAKLLDEMFSEFQARPISTFDFKKLAEKHAGKSLDWFFDAWVFGTGVPTYTLNFKIDPAPGGFAITGNITQAGVPDAFEMPVPLFADDRLLGHVTVSSSSGEFRFVTRTRPQQVLVDPQKTILTRD